MRNDRFEECYEKYCGFVFRYAFDMTQDYEVSEDISQEVFVAFYKNLPTIVPGLERAWLYRATKHAAIDYYRKISRCPEILLDVCQIDQGCMQSADGIGMLEKRLDNIALIHRILSSLEENYPLWYEALCLSCIEGMSYEEAARLLGVSASVLRSRAYRARLYIRECFRQEYE